VLLILACAWLTFLGLHWKTDHIGTLAENLKLHKDMNNKCPFIFILYFILEEKKCGMAEMSSL